METRYSKQLHTPSSLNLKQWHEYKTRMGVLGSGDRALCARCMRMPSGGAPAAVGVDLVQRAGKQPSSSHAGSRPGRAARASPGLWLELPRMHACQLSWAQLGSAPVEKDPAAASRWAATPARGSPDFFWEKGGVSVRTVELEAHARGTGRPLL